MEIQNTITPNYVREIGGDLVQPQLVTPAELEALTLSGESVIFKNVASATYYLPEMIKTQDGTTLLFKIVDIGDWNMDGSSQVNVNVGIDQTLYRIISVKGHIRNDDDDVYYPINSANAGGDIAAGVAMMYGTTVRLVKQTSGIFDHTDFNATAYNRGLLFLTYIER